MAGVEARAYAFEVTATKYWKVIFLLSFWMECGLYGVYVCLFLQTLFVMLRKRVKKSISTRVFLVGICLMFVVISVHNFLNIYRMINGLVMEDDPQKAQIFLRTARTWDGYAFPILLAVTIWLADSLVIFRCFIIWEHNYWVILLPLLILFTSIGSHSVNLWYFGNPDKVADPLKLLPTLNMTFPLHFSQNVITTGLISFKLYRQDRLARQAGITYTTAVNLITVMRIMIESALLYTTQIFVLIILFSIGSPVQVIFQHCVIPTTGIVFVLIALRAHFASENSGAGSESLLPSWVVHTSGDTADTMDSSTEAGGTSMRDSHRLQDLSRGNGSSRQTMDLLKLPRLEVEVGSGVASLDHRHSSRRRYSDDFDRPATA